MSNHLMPLSMVSKSLRQAQREHHTPKAWRSKGERAALNAQLRALVAYEAAERENEGRAELTAAPLWAQAYAQGEELERPPAGSVVSFVIEPAAGDSPNLRTIDVFSLA